MGSSLSGALSNIFVSLMEKSVLPKLIKNKEIVSWIRYADDVISICKKDTVSNMLTKINGWDQNLNFTVEKIDNNQIKFLDSNIFLENKIIKFRKNFTKGIDTVFTNFKLSISPYKYKVNNIFTQLHRTRDSCSDQEQFLLALDELREIFARNSYPRKIVEKIQKNFSRRPKTTPSRKYPLFYSRLQQSSSCSLC